jgi:hypothetical protein
MFENIKDKFVRMLSWGRQHFITLIIKQGELTNMNHFLLIKDVSEWTFHTSEDTLLVGITYRWLQKILHLDFLEFGFLVVPVKMNPVPKECLTSALNNFERT